MANTTDDKNLEYITIKNISSAEKNLKGFYLQDASWKKYIFSEDIFLKIWEKKQFFRTETRIILNNTKEELFLYKDNGDIEDTVKYEKTIKWEFLNFEILGEDSSDSIISDELYISGEVLFMSDEASIWKDEKKLQAPEVKVSLQRPNYVTQSGSNYSCDKTREKCKVNFSFLESFSSELPERDYICETNFWSWFISGQENRCNPNTIIFPEWIHEVSIKIIHEDDSSVFSHKVFIVSNIVESLVVEGEDSPTISSSSIWKQEQETIWSEDSRDNKEKTNIEEVGIYISQPRIIVQSGLTWWWRYFYCEKKKCKINLNYEKRHKDERCYWRFRSGVQSSKTTHLRCNPWYVEFEEWIHKLQLVVYEKDNEKNKKRLTFYVYNTTDYFEKDKEWQKQKEWVRIKDKNTPSDSSNQMWGNIFLQGKVSQNKTLSWSILRCHGVKSCYTNFLFDGNIEKEDLGYFWYIDKKEFSQKKNPSGIWIEWYWKHQIQLKVMIWNEIVEEKIFYVENIEENLWWKEKNEVKKESKKIKREKKSTKDTVKFTQNVRALKYDGLKFYGLAPVWSKISVFSWEIKIGESISDTKGKYKFLTKNIQKGDYDFHFILEFWTEKIEKVKEFTLLSKDKIYWFQTTKKSANTYKYKTKKQKQLKMQNIFSVEKEEQGLNYQEKILYIVLIGFSLLIWFSHMIFLEFWSVTGKGILQIYVLQFSVKQRISLIV